MDDSQDYTYESAGLDGFLSRSIDNLSQVTLDSPGPVTTSMAYDRSQVTGSLGDTLQLGKINFNGSAGNIIINDGTNDFLIMGEDI